MKALDYFAPFAYFFKDKNWPGKFLLASLLTCTIIGAAPILGWTLTILGRIGHGNAPEVPDLLDWKNYWKLGGQFALINAVWLLPVLLAVILLYLPLVFVNSIKPEMLLVVFGGTLGCVLIFLLAYSFMYVFLLPSMMIQLVETGSTGQAMNPLRLWKLARLHFTEHLVVFLIVGVGLFNLVLLIAPFTLFLFLPPMLVYTGLVSVHFSGQLARLNRSGMA
jgi:hypothetical protein